MGRLPAQPMGREGFCDPNAQAHARDIGPGRQTRATPEEAGPAAFSSYLAQLWAGALRTLDAAGLSLHLLAEVEAWSPEERTSRVVQSCDPNSLEAELGADAGERAAAAVDVLKMVLAIRQQLAAPTDDANAPAALANFGLLCMAAGSAELVMRGAEAGAWRDLSHLANVRRRRSAAAQALNAAQTAWRAPAIAAARSFAEKAPTSSAAQLTALVLETVVDVDLPDFDQVQRVIRAARRAGAIPAKVSPRRSGNVRSGSSEAHA